MKSLKLVAILSVTLLAACASVGTTRQQSSLMGYLYPDGQPQAQSADVATVKLPLRLGIMLAPTVDTTRSGYILTPRVNQPLSTGDQVSYLDQIATEFRTNPEFKDVEVIPSTYVQEGGGFKNMETLASMYSVDAIAIVSYDQLQTTDEGKASFLYWTVIGAYVVDTEKNASTTFVDTAMFDVKSHKLLFHASGTSKSASSGTLANNSEEVRGASHQGFIDAFAAMAADITTSLANFKTKLAGNDQFKVVETAPATAPK
jgi:rhombotail lipoprotein